MRAAPCPAGRRTGAAASIVQSVKGAALRLDTSWDMRSTRITSASLTARKLIEYGTMMLVSRISLARGLQDEDEERWSENVADLLYTSLLDGVTDHRHIAAHSICSAGNENASCDAVYAPAPPTHYCSTLSPRFTRLHLAPALLLVSVPTVGV